MNFDELKEEVQRLRDELALFKREYENTIENLGSQSISDAETSVEEIIDEGI